MDCPRPSELPFVYDRPVAASMRSSVNKCVARVKTQPGCQMFSYPCIVALPGHLRPEIWQIARPLTVSAPSTTNDR